MGKLITTRNGAVATVLFSNPEKMNALRALGVTIDARVRSIVKSNPFSAFLPSGLTVSGG